MAPQTQGFTENQSVGRYQDNSAGSGFSPFPVMIKGMNETANFENGFTHRFALFARQ